MASPSSDSVKTAKTLWHSTNGLPLTPNGKVDRKALPTAGPTEGGQDHGRGPGPDHGGDEHGLPGASQPSTESEKLLTAVWRELLDREDFGIDDGFFNLGGHSLMAIKLIFMIREQSGVELPLQVLFEGEPTIRG